MQPRPDGGDRHIEEERDLFAAVPFDLVKDQGGASAIATTATSVRARSPQLRSTSSKMRRVSPTRTP
jgi:hypothetical protein